MQLKRIQGYTFGLLLVVSLSACGSDGDTPTSPPATAAATSAEGLWTGTIGTDRIVSWLVLDEGVYWALYSEASNPTIIAGIVQGDSSSQNGAFTSSNPIDFNLQTGMLPATITGSYTVKQSLSGQIAYPGGPTAFTTKYDNDYDLTPDINAVAGKYTGFVTASETVMFELTATGDIISGSSSTGCQFTGSFSPRTQGNVYNVTVTFGNQATCSNRNETVNGIGFYDADAKRLSSAALNSTKTDGFVFIGTKQP